MYGDPAAAAPGAAAAATPAAPTAGTRLLKGSGGPVFLGRGGNRYFIPDPETFTSMGFDWGSIQTVDDASLRQFVDMGALPHLDEGALWVRGTLSPSTGPD